MSALAEPHAVSHQRMPVQVRWWDVAAGEQLFRLEGHTDYVRSAAANPSSPDVWATGGYDHVCRLWDVRSQQVGTAAVSVGVAFEQ